MPSIPYKKTGRYTATKYLQQSRTRGIREHMGSVLRTPATFELSSEGPLRVESRSESA